MDPLTYRWDPKFKSPKEGRTGGRTNSLTMSTAHRPTWIAALGGDGSRDGATSAPTYQQCSKDMPAHTKLKYRKIGQDAPEELAGQWLRPEPKLKSIEAGADEEEEPVDEDDADTDIEDVISEAGESSDPSDSQDDEEDDEDETAELLRELEKIKREREDQARRETAKRDQEILSSNPLINLSSSAKSDDATFTVKRRWDDDVVFKNQAKGVETKPKKRFINDTTRSDFHRKFLDKYII